MQVATTPPWWSQGPCREPISTKSWNQSWTPHTFTRLFPILTKIKILGQRWWVEATNVQDLQSSGGLDNIPFFWVWRFRNWKIDKISEMSQNRKDLHQKSLKNIQKIIALEYFSSILNSKPWTILHSIPLGFTIGDFSRPDSFLPNPRRLGIFKLVVCGHQCVNSN